MYLADVQWYIPPDFGAVRNVRPRASPPRYNPNWDNIRPGMQGYRAPYAGEMQMMN